MGVFHLAFYNKPQLLHMLIKALLISSFLLVGIGLSAQKERHSHGVWLKLNLSSLLDPGAPGIQTGLEYRINNHWAIETNYGIPYYIGHDELNRDSNFHKNYKIKSEIKLFYGHQSVGYFAIEFFYTHLHYNSFNHYYFDNTGSYYYKDAQYWKSIFGSGFKIGFNIPIAHRISIDIFSNAGIRLVDTKVSSSSTVPSPVPSTHWFSAAEQVGNKVTPHIAFGIKFGYWLFK